MAILEKDLELASGGGFVIGRPADDALLSLLASMACTDGVVHEKELDFLEKVRVDLGERSDVEAWARSHARKLDVSEVAKKVGTPDERWKTLRFAARMAWKDGEIAQSERQFLGDLAVALQLPIGAAARVLREMEPDDGTGYTSERILRILLDVHWDAVQLASGGLVSEDLIGVSPPRVDVVARVGLEKVEIMALCTEGIAARFQEGPAFLRWQNLVTYTRHKALGASLVLHTEDGSQFSLVDQRLAGLAFVLDRLMDRQGRKPDPDAAPPKIDTLRGE